MQFRLTFPMFRCSKGGKIIFFVFTLVWLHLKLSSAEKNRNENRVADQLESPAVESVSEAVSANGKSVGSEHGRLETLDFINLPKPRLLKDEEIEEIGRKIQWQNIEQRIYNLEKFGTVNEGTYVLVIQVHSRVEYLKLLIQSLSRMRNVENTLVIFSHDLYIPQLNEVIRKIDFTRVMQIFYPYSIQLNPRKFPGQMADDCPRNISPAKAREIKCRNAAYPDVHGHYREARYTQIKHHWWWKANFVFGQINVLKNYSGVIGFLEEDHYVTPDFLWVLNLMQIAMIRNLCHDCNLLVLGTYLDTWTFSASHSRAVVTNWVSSKHNMGMAFNRTLWKKFKKCTPTFCDYDDYNWDWSLLQVSHTCLDVPLTVLYANAARIFHIGDCGTHHKKKQCDPNTAAKAIDKRVKQYHSRLFPESLTVEVEVLFGNKIRLKTGNGGWGDIRDRRLCLSF